MPSARLRQASVNCNRALARLRPAKIPSIEIPWLRRGRLQHSFFRRRHHSISGSQLGAPTILACIGGAKLPEKAAGIRHRLHPARRLRRARRKSLRAQRLQRCKSPCQRLQSHHSIRGGGSQLGAPDMLACSGGTRKPVKAAGIRHGLHPARRVRRASHTTPLATLRQASVNCNRALARLRPANR